MKNRGGRFFMASGETMRAVIIVEALLGVPAQ
jgi:hypothetical protein